MVLGNFVTKISLLAVTFTQKKLSFEFEIEFGIPHSNLKSPKISILHTNSHLNLNTKKYFESFRFLRKLLFLIEFEFDSHDFSI
jgi:hypothetical protein